MSRDELRETFFQECEDLLEVLDSGLSAIDDGSDDPETINAVFRAVHSIKGGAGAFALGELVKFAHMFETTLDEVRGERTELTRELLAIFLRASDMLSDLVQSARGQGNADEAAIAQTLEELKGFVGASSDEEGDGGFEPLTLDLDFDAGETGGLNAGSRFRISFRPNRKLYERGNETTLLLRALGDLGDCETACDLSDLPPFDDLAGEEAYLGWTIELTTEAGAEDIHEIFEFAADDCELTIEEIAADASLCEVEAPVGDNPAEPAGEATTAGAVAGTAKAAEQPAAPAKVALDDAPRPTIRVDLDRVERLINLVGELVINQAMLSQSVTEIALPQNSVVNDGLDELKQLTRNIQESVMAIRAQPVKPLFQRMSRIIREAAQETGKLVRLVTDGADTEVDKTVVERLADPLTHMIRNAVDHGLEMPEARAGADKPREGVVRLTAAHRSGRVMIEVSDDGAGIDRDLVRKIAIDKGLIPDDASLTNSEVDNLLFLPGFSTATEVSSLSGRGVGMDVVRKAIQSLGGRISIASEPAAGTTLTISLPLTLAVLDGIVVDVAGETLIVPLTSVVETMKPSSEDICRIDPSSWALHLRGEFVPVIDIGFELGFRGRLSSLDGKVILVTGAENGSHDALIIDAVHDQRQVVIKSLATNYGDVPGIAAATILGDGRIALILDIDVLVARAANGLASQETALVLAG